jgi:hypothetical protein
MPSRLCRRHHLDSCHVRSLYRSFTAVGEDLIVHNTEFHCPDFPYTSYFNKRTLTSWSRTTEATRTTGSSFCWVIGTETEMGLSRRRTRLSNAVSPRGRIRPHVRTCFLTHYIRYYGIKRQITCVSRLTATAKAFSRTRNLFMGCGLIKLVFEV